MAYVQQYPEPSADIAHAADEVMHYFRDVHPLHVAASDAPNGCEHTGKTVHVFGLEVGVQLTDTGLFFGHAWDDEFVKSVSDSQTNGNWELMTAQCCDVFTYLAIQAGHVNLAVW
jgi:hypothetical protein